MVDVTTMPDKSFGYVPTPAIVGPLEFTLRQDEYAALGGHMKHVRSLETLRDIGKVKVESWPREAPWPVSPLEAAK